ncbi:MAG: DUF1109 domain-containing protein [Kiloniellaceae bacterium]
MKTEDFAGFLAAGAGPAPRALAARRLAPALALGGLASLALSLAVLGPVPSSMWVGAALWTKLCYAGALIVACAWLAARLGRPAAAVWPAAAASIAVFCAMALAGLVALVATPAGGRATYLLGQSAIHCPWVILALSLPALVGVLWALRALAPTRPRLAGFAAGLLAGAVGAAGYALACTEESISFIALWYSLGIFLAGLLGSVLGARALRW